MISIVIGEKSKILRKEKGITLIALAVTIIVLLILAGVSIQMITGQNGILKRAKEAGDKTKRAEVIEIAQMEIYDKEVAGDGEITAKELHDILDEYFENVPELGEDGTWEDYPYNFKEPLVSKEDKKIEIEIGEIYKGELRDVKKRVTPEEVVGNLKGYIGAYVNYGVELDNNPSTPDWRIFYAQNVEGEGNRVYLIAADYVPTDNEALVDAMGGGTTKAMMKTSTETYKDLCVNWTSSLPNDLQPITLENWKNIFKDGSYILTDLYNNSKCVARLRETENWAKFTEGTGGEYAIGGPTAHMWCEAWNTIVNTEDGYAKINISESLYDYGYKYKGTTEEHIYMYMNGTTSEGNMNLNKLSSDDTYSLFFPHTTKTGIIANGKPGDCYGYWLTSPSAGVHPNQPDGSLMYVAYIGCVSYNPYVGKYGVRPLVSLTSGIRLTESSTILKGKPVYNIVQ